MKPTNTLTPAGPSVPVPCSTARIVCDHPGASSHYDGQVWIPIGFDGGVWLKPGEALAVITTAETPSLVRLVSPNQSLVNWAAVRIYYEGTRSPKQTAAHFDIPIDTVKARARRGRWGSSNSPLNEPAVRITPHD